jgi:hypothetical protein
MPSGCVPLVFAAPFTETRTPSRGNDSSKLVTTPVIVLLPVCPKAKLKIKAGWMRMSIDIRSFTIKKS